MSREKIKQFFLVGFTVTLSVCLVSPAWAEIYNASPAQSFKKAVSRLKAGDTLRLTDGIYSDSAIFISSGTENAPITIEGTKNVLINGDHIGKYQPVFETKGQSHIQFKNLNFENVRAGVQVDEGSRHILIDGLHADRCQFAVLMKNASFVTVKNSRANNSRNAFRGEGDTHDVSFENVEAYDSKDIYKGYDTKNYLNGDGFIFESKTYNLNFKNIISANHWDGGLDIKGSHVVLENIKTYGCKNGLKLWGEDITVRNALIYGAKSQVHANGSKVDGGGINIRSGSVRVFNTTVSDNELYDVKVKEGASLYIEDSIVARHTAEGGLLLKSGNFTQKNVVWFQKGREPLPFSSSDGSSWGDPQFRDWKNGDYCPDPKGPGAACVS